MDVEPTDDGLRLSLSAQEADLLRRLTDELRSVLRASDDPDDPVIARLFPDAYEDPEEAREYRELTAETLEAAKLEALTTIRGALGKRGGATADLPPEDAESWIRALTDLRLTLGVHLDVDEEQMAGELDPDDPQAGSLAVLHWLGYLQQTMLEALGEPPEPGP